MSDPRQIPYEDAAALVRNKHLSAIRPDRFLVLLGAGASVEAGVPAARAMTDKMLAAIEKKPGGLVADTLHLVHDVLLKEGASYVDIEHLFSAVMQLAERDDLEVAPFVTAWNPLLDELIATSVRAGWTRGRRNVLRETADAMLDALRELVVADSDRLDYLAPLLQLADRDGGLTIATLNYDTTIEHVYKKLSRRTVADPTSVDHWGDHHTWAWEGSGLRLLKLHGSANWHKVSLAGWDDRGTYPTVWREERWLHGINYAAGGMPFVVFGRRGKLRPDGPFLSLLGQFERFLAEARCLLVIGYSFRDDHINALLVWWLTASSGANMVIVDPFFPEQTGPIGRNLPANHNYSGAKGIKPREQVHVINATTSEALRGLFT